MLQYYNTAEYIALAISPAFSVTEPVKTMLNAAFRNNPTATVEIVTEGDGDDSDSNAEFNFDHNDLTVLNVNNYDDFFEASIVIAESGNFTDLKSIIDNAVLVANSYTSNKCAPHMLPSNTSDYTTTSFYTHLSGLLSESLRGDGGVVDALPYMRCWDCAFETHPITNSDESIRNPCHSEDDMSSSESLQFDGNNTQIVHSSVGESSDSCPEFARIRERCAPPDFSEFLEVAILVS